MQTIRVNKQNLTDLPKDLYISPEALQIFLEMFEGPLDLLLYLIRKQNLDILTIPIAKITDQYILYINAMATINIDLAAEYLSMAATLLAIKSRLMLPHPPKLEEEYLEETNLDPRNELINKLIEYEKIKQATAALSNIPTEGYHYRWSNIEVNSSLNIPPNIKPENLKDIWLKILLHSITQNTKHRIKRQELSIREYMTNILRKLSGKDKITFISIFDQNLGVTHIIVSFIAILELTKEGLIQLSMSKNDIILVAN
jgi:segregation and condensation protein A